QRPAALRPRPSGFCAWHAESKEGEHASPAHTPAAHQRDDRPAGGPRDGAAGGARRGRGAAAVTASSSTAGNRCGEDSPLPRRGAMGSDQESHRPWLAFALEEALRRSLFSPKDILGHVSPEVLVSHLPHQVISEILSRALASGTFS